MPLSEPDLIRRIVALTEAPMLVTRRAAGEPVVSANQAFAELVGRNADELQGVPFAGAIPQERRAELAAWNIYALVDGEAETKVASLSELREALVSGPPDNHVVFANNRDAMSVFDAETGRFLAVNDAWVEQYGYTRDEAMGMTPKDVSAEPSLTQSSIARSLEEQDKSSNISLRWHRRKDGSTFPVELSCETSFLHGRQVLCAVLRDITDRLRNAEALQRSERTFRSLVETIPDAVLVHRGDEVTYMNPSARRLLGFDMDEPLGELTIGQLMPHDEVEPFRIRTGQVLGGQPVGACEGRLIKRDGSGVSVELAAMLVGLDGGHAVLTVARDMTERKQMEARLATADRLASVGRLAASVGHEINNPLTYVIGNLELLDRELTGLADLGTEQIEKLRARVEVARSGAERVADIVQDLKILARSDGDETGSVDLHRVLDVCASMADHEIRHRARCETDYGPPLTVRGSEGRLGQVFLNLLVNAAQAMGEGDTANNCIRISTSPGDGMAIVEISDTGPGIADEVAGRLFEPFVTTKAHSAGSGLGLSICHHIVTGLGGQIEVEANQPRGTRFRVRLPLAEEPISRRMRSSAPPSTPQGLRVLVVDDEPLIVRLLQHHLGEYRVASAANGTEALQALAKHTFDVIVCDLMMPDVSGMDVFRYLEGEHPGMERRIIFMSGGAFTDRARTFLEGIGNPYLGKPFGMDAVNEAVRQVVEAEGPAERRSRSA